MSNLGTVLGSFVTLINGTLVPLVFAVALVMFLWGITQYFFIGANNQESKEKGRQFAIYAVIGFVIMAGIWGLVNLLSGTLQLTNQNAPTPPTFNGGSSGSGYNGNGYNGNGFNSGNNPPIGT